MDLEKTLQKAKSASRKLAILDDKKIGLVLGKLSQLLIKNSAKIIGANKKDLKKIDKNDPIYDRLLLSSERIKSIADSVKVVAKYKSPIGKILEDKIMKSSGLRLQKVSVPLGLICVIFEARPNVVIDVFALCFKSKNACVLKGGTLAENSNEILVKIIKESLKSLGIEEDVVTLLSNDRKVISKVLQADKYIDVVIPRGSKNLIDFVRKNSSIPVIETGAGVVHIFFDESADLFKGREIVFNAKTTRPSVCNAMDTLIVHEKRLKDLAYLCGRLSDKEVMIFADATAYKALDGKYPKKLLCKAKAEHFGVEYLSLKMSIKTVKNLDETIEHITKYGSGHSESILTENKKNAEEFLQRIDAAAVYVNASTRFTDGGEFGLGAEIGISTQKLHARGPMGISELTSYKWLVRGKGQIR